MNQHNHARSDAATVLEFWFGALEGGAVSETMRRRWFAADTEFDQEVARRFGEFLVQAARGALTHWLDDAHSCLAFIVVTDQFSRQIHRGRADAFATDALALGAAQHGIERQFDRALSTDERSFMYLPFEHSESLAHQQTSVALFTQLLDDAPPALRSHCAESLRYARAHHDIVRDFGRFPHRNGVLGRTSTDAELAFLRTASRFGQ